MADAYSSFCENNRLFGWREVGLVSRPAFHDIRAFGPNDGWHSR